MKKVIVTGAGGFIGGAVTNRLLNDGIKVYGIDLSGEKLNGFRKYKNFIPIIGDLSKIDLSGFINDESIDCFIHTAWKGSLLSKDLYNYSLQNENIELACTACQAAVRLSVKRVVFCGSSYQNMIADNVDFPINYYGIAKRAAADYFMAISHKSNIECNIAILTNTYGIGDYSPKAVNTFIRKMLNNETINLIEGSNPNDWVYIDDTANGIISAAFSPYCYKNYYIGHLIISTFKEKLLQMREILGSFSELLFGTYDDNTFVDYTNLNAGELINDTGFECKADFRESILKTAEWVKTLNWEEN